MYEAEVDGKAWELQSIGDVAPFFRLLIDGKHACDFESSDWPATWTKPGTKRREKSSRRRRPQ
jgi:hypothetical protein